MNFLLWLVKILDLYISSYCTKFPQHCLRNLYLSLVENFDNLFPLVPLNILRFPRNFALYHWSRFQMFIFPLASSLLWIVPEISIFYWLKIFMICSPRFHYILHVSPEIWHSPIDQRCLHFFLFLSYYPRHFRCCSRIGVKQWTKRGTKPKTYFHSKYDSLLPKMEFLKARRPNFHHWPYWIKSTLLKYMGIITGFRTGEFSRMMRILGLTMNRHFMIEVFKISIWIHKYSPSRLWGRP